MDGIPVNQGFVWGLATVGLLAGVAAAQDSSSTDAADFRYLHGFDATGSFEGTCSLAGFRFTPHERGEFSLASQGGRLVVVETWLNETHVAPATPAYHVLVAPIHQTVREEPIPAGPLDLSWDARDHVLLAQETRDGVGRLEAHVGGAQWNSGAPDRSFPLGVTYYEPDPDTDPLTDDVVELAQVVYGPARPLSTNGMLVPVEGSGFLKMDGAHVSGTGFDWDLPPHRQVVRETSLAGVVERTVVETHAVLRLDGLQTTLEADRGDLYCSRLDWSGAGAVTYRTTVGRARRGAETVMFERQELTLQGEFASRESIQTSPELGARHYLVADSQGRFDAIGVDFSWVTPVADGLDVPLAAAVGLLALLVAALGWIVADSARLVAFFYSRVGVERALEHPTRARIVEAARDRPGLILRELVETTGRHYGVIRHHASILAHLGLVSTLRHGKALHVYPPATSLPTARRDRVLARDAPVGHLMDLLLGGPQPLRGILDALQARFGFSRPGCWKVVRRAERVGLVERQRSTTAGVVLSARS